MMIGAFIRTPRPIKLNGKLSPTLWAIKHIEIERSLAIQGCIRPGIHRPSD